MTSDRRDLPDFADPPVNEVVLGVQFQELDLVQPAHVGLFWDRVRSRYPVVEEQPPLEPMADEPEPHAPRVASITVQVMETPPLARTWFRDHARTALLQLQRDRLVHNWRKAEPADNYPRYERVRSDFEDDAKRFLEFLTEEKLGQFVPELCEVAYINSMPAGAAWEGHGDLGKVLTTWQPRYSDAFLTKPESVRILETYVMNDHEGQFAGRLRVQVEPVFRITDKQPMLMLTLSARGRPIGEGLEGVLAFFDLGRQWIVRGFASITTRDMQERWGRRQ